MRRRLNTCQRPCEMRRSRCDWNIASSCASVEPIAWFIEMKSEAPPLITIAISPREILHVDSRGFDLRAFFLCPYTKPPAISRLEKFLFFLTCRDEDEHCRNVRDMSYCCGKVARCKTFACNQVEYFCSAWSGKWHTAVVTAERVAPNDTCV